MNYKFEWHVPFDLRPNEPLRISGQIDIDQTFQQRCF